MKAHCPKCGTPLKFSDEKLGKHGKCPHCHHDIVAKPDPAKLAVPPPLPQTADQSPTTRRVFTITWGAVAAVGIGATAFILHDLITHKSPASSQAGTAAKRQESQPVDTVTAPASKADEIEAASLTAPKAAPAPSETTTPVTSTAVQPTKSNADEIRGKVVSVTDGDTIRVVGANNSDFKVRLEGIDAPESGQPFGTKAKQALSEKIYGANVVVRWKQRDKYNRILGDVLLGDRHINTEMVSDGFAWHYKQFSSDSQLSKAETDAREAKRGLWADPNPMPPWEWRRGGATLADAGDAAAKTDESKAIVYITKSGKKYHSAGCSFLSQSSIPISLADAKARGYTPCSKCGGHATVHDGKVSESDSDTTASDSALTPSTSDPATGSTASGQTIYTGPRGGQYHYSKNGKKVYEKRRK